MPASPVARPQRLALDAAASEGQFTEPYTSGAAVALPIWILVDAGSIKAPCQPESRRESNGQTVRPVKGQPSAPPSLAN